MFQLPRAKVKALTSGLRQPFVPKKAGRSALGAAYGRQPPVDRIYLDLGLDPDLLQFGRDDLAIGGQAGQVDLCQGRGEAVRVG